jgi:hypothetical protein
MNTETVERKYMMEAEIYAESLLRRLKPRKARKDFLKRYPELEGFFDTVEYNMSLDEEY